MTSLSSDLSDDNRRLDWYAHYAERLSRGAGIRAKVPRRPFVAPVAGVLRLFVPVGGEAWEARGLRGRRRDVGGWVPELLDFRGEKGLTRGALLYAHFVAQTDGLFVLDRRTTPPILGRHVRRTRSEPSADGYDF